MNQFKNHSGFLIGKVSSFSRRLTLKNFFKRKRGKKK